MCAQGLPKAREREPRASRGEPSCLLTVLCGRVAAPDGTVWGSGLRRGGGGQSNVWCAVTDSQGGDTPTHTLTHTHTLRDQGMVAVEVGGL